MSYVLFFKVESQKDSRCSFAKQINTLEEALIEREILIRNGYRDEKVIHTRLIEGRI